LSEICIILHDQLSFGFYLLHIFILTWLIAESHVHAYKCT